MANLIEVKASYEKTTERGRKKVTELYIVNAESFADAEVRIIEELAPYSDSDVEVKAVKKSQVKEIIYSLDDCNKWFKVKIINTTLNEKTGEDKNTPYLMLVGAENVNQAIKTVEKANQSSLLDWYIHSVIQTDIVEVIEVKQQ